MNKDSIMRNLATLNQLWDATPITTQRRTSESFTVRGARLTIALQVQEPTLRHFFERSEGLARGTGFLARFLLAWPASTQGSRKFKEAPATWAALSQFNQRISTILAQHPAMDDQHALTTMMMTLPDDAKAGWVAFHDPIERELSAEGDLYTVRDVASKIADNAVRLAALFQCFEASNSMPDTINLAMMERATRIATWHLHEAQRFYGELALSAAQADAIKLEGWLRDYSQRHRARVIARRTIQREVTPARLRKKTALDAALTELVDHGRVRLVTEGKSKQIELHPVLCEGVNHDLA